MTTLDSFFWTRVARLHHRCTSKRDVDWARSFITRLRAVLFLPRCWQNTTSLKTVAAENVGKEEQYAYRCKCRGRGRSRWSAKISIACWEYLFPSPFETFPAYLSGRCLRATASVSKWKETNGFDFCVTAHAIASEAYSLMFCALADLWRDVFRRGIAIQRWYSTDTDSWPSR